MRFTPTLLLLVSISAPLVAQSGVIITGLSSTTDVGPQIMSAITALPGGCGEVIVPAGSYVQQTTVIKPRCVKLRGEAAYSTVLNWQPTTGAAIVVADSSGVNNYPEGDISDITLSGPGGSSTSIGIYLGGDPGGHLSHTSDYGDHQNLNQVRVIQFGTGIQWGNNTWSTAISQSLISNDGTGLSFPSGLTNAGESISVYGSRIQNSLTGLNLVGFSDFYFYGSSCDYNITCGNVNAGHFYGMHFEQSMGPILTITGTSQPHVEIIGGWAQVSCLAGQSQCGSDPYMFFVNSNLNPLFKLDGTFLLAGHPVSQVVHWIASGGAEQLILNDLPYHAANLPSLTDAACEFWGCRIQDGTGNGAINNARWSVHLDGAASFDSITTTQNGAGATVGNFSGFAQVKGNGTGLRLDPTNGTESTPIYLTNGTLNATGSQIVADRYVGNAGTTAPTGSCTQPGALVITGDGHGTYCRAGSLTWTTLY
jgi:hypothetical protein